MGKQKLVAQLGLIIQEEKLPVAPALLQHPCFSFPPSLYPQDNVKAECEPGTNVAKAEPGSKLLVIWVVLQGGISLPSQRTRQVQLDLDGALW